MVSHIARRLRFGLLILALALAACSGDDGGPALPDGGADAGLDAPDAAVDLSAALFPRDRVLDVQITMAPADWAALRSQPRPSDLSDTTCAWQPTAPGYKRGMTR